MRKRVLKPQLDADRLTEKRIQKGWSKIEASEHMNSPQSVYSKYESGISKPSYSALRNVALTLGTNIEYLTNRSDDDNPTEYLISNEDHDLFYIVDTYQKSTDKDKQRLITYVQKLHDNN